MIQQELPSYSLSLSISPLCLAASEHLQHLFFTCPFEFTYWVKLFDFFGLNWVFDKDLLSDVHQLLLGIKLKRQANLLSLNAVKALLSELWFERNQSNFQEKVAAWSD